MVERHSRAPSHYCSTSNQVWWCSRDACEFTCKLHVHCTTAQIVTPYPNSTPYTSALNASMRTNAHTNYVSVHVCIRILRTYIDLTLAYGLKGTTSPRPTTRKLHPSTKTTRTKHQLRPPILTDNILHSHQTQKLPEILKRKKGRSRSYETSAIAFPFPMAYPAPFFVTRY